MIPVVPYNRPRRDVVPVDGGSAANFTFLHPYHPVKDFHLEEAGDLPLLRQDPFFILSHLLLEAARSWSQLLTFMEKDIEACAIANETHLVPILEQVRFNANLVARVQGFLIENLHVVKERGRALWPRATDPYSVERIQVIQDSLIMNYEYLIGRCRHLASMCERGSGILVSAAQLMEAHEGTNQARQVHRLTKLAFIFIPLTYISSLFGMNVSAFESYPSIWIYFLVAIPITALSWIVPGTTGYSSQIRRYLRHSIDSFKGKICDSNIDHQRRHP